MIFYEEYGDKTRPALIMVHGLTQNRKIFSKQVHHFKDKYHVVVVDLRGHGNSDMIDGPYGFEEYTDDLQELLKYKNIKNAVYWGTHTGAAIGLNLIFRNSIFLSCLILESAVVPGYATPETNAYIEHAQRLVKEMNLDAAVQNWVNNSAWFEYMKKNPVPARYYEHIEIIREFTGKPWKSSEQTKQPRNIYADLEKIKTPLLVYNGGYDMPEFIEMAIELEKKANAKRMIITNSGGFPCWENPDTVNAIVESFISGVRK
jgi:3-oxoadipate enol-lactonase